MIGPSHPTRSAARARPVAARARLALAVLAAAAVLACGRAAPRAARSGLLVTMDTTNASALDCYGARGVTPALARLAEESIVYESARTTVPVTLPAHASMLTGLYPPRHGVRDNGLGALSASAVTLAERAKAAGLDTAAFLSAAVLAAPFGLDQGFDAYDSPGGASASAALLIHERPASETVRAARAWLASRDRSRPFFLWVHLFDPHYPYAPPPEFAERAGGDVYLGEVAAKDASIGELLDALRASGELDETLVVVLADHGEALGRHGEESHSVYCYDSTLAVPLLVRHPDGRGAGTRSRAPVSAVDVLPTFVAALGLGGPGDVDGMSLFAGDPPAERGIYFESYAAFVNYRWSPLAGWLQGGLKLVHGAAPLAFDVASDPGETSDVAAQRAAELERARDGIRAVAAKPALARDDGAAIDEALREQVRALGYAGMGDASLAMPHPLQPGDLPDPHARKEELVQLNRVLALAGERRRREAIALLVELRQSDPANPFVHLHLGGMLYQEQRYEEALGAFRALLALEPALSRDQESWIQGYVGTLLERRGELASALAHYRRALALAPDDAERRQRVARVEEALAAAKAGSSR
jgi:arylsulfatase A-like enzyme